MVIKIGIIEASKFDANNYSETVRNSFTDFLHRNKPYKRLEAFSHYIDGSAFDLIFESEAEFEAWLVFVPQTISKLQAVKRLLDTGRYTDLMTAIDKDPTGVSRILFEAAYTLARDSNMVNEMAAGLGFSDEDTDEFFVEADKIMI